MKFLIDTQILIWSISSIARLSNEVKQILIQNEIYVSQISFLEIAIKQSINKLPGVTSSVEEIREQAKADGLEILEITSKHIDCYSSIPLFTDHRDPFDRLLIDTAVAENMFLISSDPKFYLYTPQLQLISN